MIEMMSLRIFPGSVSVLEGHRGAGAAGAPSRHRLKVYGFAAQSAEKFLTTVIFFRPGRGLPSRSLHAAVFFYLGKGVEGRLPWRTSLYNRVCTYFKGVSKMLD